MNLTGKGAEHYPRLCSFQAMVARSLRPRTLVMDHRTEIHDSDPSRLETIQREKRLAGVTPGDESDRSAHSYLPPEGRSHHHNPPRPGGTARSLLRCSFGGSTARPKTNRSGLPVTRRQQIIGRPFARRNDSFSIYQFMRAVMIVRSSARRGAGVSGSNPWWLIPIDALSSRIPVGNNMP